MVSNDELAKMAVEDFPKFKEALRHLAINKMLGRKQQALEGLYEQFPYLPPRVTREYAQAMFEVGVMCAMGMIDSMKDVQDFLRSWPFLDEAVEKAIVESIKPMMGEN